MSKRVSLGLFVVLMSFGAYAQKVKYKDLIVLLTSKQYDKAEPFLKRYLKENDDNPNAYLYMGITFQEKVLKEDPLLRTDLLCATIDSALTNFDKAYQTITEKELRKNDEYYEPYMRRDLRTGKFVIKLSDVQLDVETRTRNLKERKEKVKLLKKYFDEFTAAYLKANGIYKSIQSGYQNEKEFFLQSNEASLAQIKRLALVFDSSIQVFDKYKAVIKELGKTGHDQVIALQEIKDFKHDGLSDVDFLKDDLRIWDYKRWALQSQETYEKEIIPMREQLVAFDIEINKFRSELQKDSVSVKNKVEAFVKKIGSSQITKYDSDPMPLAVITMKIAELDYQSHLILNKPYRDSIDVRLRLAVAKMEVGDLQVLDSLATILNKRNFIIEEKNYRDFITKSYGTTSVLQSTVSSTLDFAKRERAKRMLDLKAATESMKWIVNAGDSIPLSTDINREIKFKPLGIDPEKFTFGIVYKDTVSSEGYFYSITPSRIPDVKAKYPLEPSIFKRSLFPFIKGLATTDPAGNSFITVVYSTQKVKDNFQATVTKIYKADGLSWSNTFSFDSLPIDLSLNSETGEIFIKMLTAEGSAKLVTIDKNGKQK